MGLHAQEIDLGLERVSAVAERLQVERPAPFVITVAGTNGKGSSVAMLGAILRCEGYRVGCYTSPHIRRFNERIVIDSEPVAERQIVHAFADIEAARGQIKLTYFEFATLAALLIFKQSQVDVAVLEVGLGGRLDAVNLVDADAALITAIDVDHVAWLGDDRAKIAIEKAGITRPFKPAVCSDPHPPQSLMAYARAHQVPLSCLGQDFHYRQTDQAWSIYEASEFNEQSASKSWPLPNLKGAFQLQNAAGVIRLLQQIHERLPVGDLAIVNGLQCVEHAGRLQGFKVGSQDWLVDVAHNPQSAMALADFLTTQHPVPKFDAVFSVLNDKDCLPMIRQIAPWVDRWWIADLQMPRATPVAELHALLLEAGVAESRIVDCSSIDQAVAQAILEGAVQVLVWGSFITVSQAMQALEVRQAESLSQASPLCSATEQFSV